MENKRSNLATKGSAGRLELLACNGVLVDNWALRDPTALFDAEPGPPACDGVFWAKLVAQRRYGVLW